MPQDFFLQNSMTGTREKLETRTPGKVTFYTCGPTVYNLIHIGNLRAALTADLLSRALKAAGYEVTYVRNYTDVDDKIIDRSKAEGTTSLEVSEKYIQEVEKDYALAGMSEPTHKTKVTDHIPEIVDLIERIIQNGKGYVVEGGEVLFSIEAFEGYGKLSKRVLDEQQAGARVEVKGHKRNPMDFTLWKPAKPGEPKWPSPWCDGRPGWHIECSAMACKWLGDQIDIHHGGEDLIFPHHENEIAQTEAATGKAPYVRYWVHNAFLNIDKEKMSKSLGNIVSARDFLQMYGADLTRYLLLSAHYRSIIDFGPEALEQALSGLARIYEAKAKAKQLSQIARAMPDLRAESLWGEFVAEVESTRTAIKQAFFNDLNTPEALGALFTLIRSFNRTLAEPLTQATPAAILAAQAFIELLERDLGSVLGIGRDEPSRALARLDEIRKTRAERAGGAARLAPEQIQAMLDARKEARARKDFAEGDRIRKELESQGVDIKDGPQGTLWSYR